jgi:hypothetical protein
MEEEENQQAIGGMEIHLVTCKASRQLSIL